MFINCCLQFVSVSCFKRLNKILQYLWLCIASLKSIVLISKVILITGCGLIGLIIVKSEQTKPQVPHINPSTQEGVETAPVTCPDV